MIEREREIGKRGKEREIERVGDKVEERVMLTV